MEYVELRALDVSPFDPVGINQKQMRFLEVFLVYCLLEDSPPIGKAEFLDICTMVLTTHAPLNWALISVAAIIRAIWSSFAPATDMCLGMSDFGFNL